MKKAGFIGYGSMASMLVNGFIETGVLKPDEILVSTRSLERLQPLKERYPNITVATTNSLTAAGVRTLFICVKPLEVRSVLLEIQDVLSPDTHLVSIAGCFTLANLERLVHNPVTKVIPSLTSEVKQGITLVCHNKRVSEMLATDLENLLNAVSQVKRIAETDFEVATDLTSCAPGLFSALFDELVEAALRHSSLSREEAESMVVETIYGTAKLWRDKKMGFSETVSRVATKGGITEEGVKVLHARLPDVFDELFRATLSKHEVNKGKINAQFE